MLHVQELGYLLARAYPDLKRSRDYWVAHPVNDDLEQSGPAHIIDWRSEKYPRPMLEDIEKLWKLYGAECETWWAGEQARMHRADLLTDADRLVEKAIDTGNAPAEKAARNYRQALRDVPQQRGFPHDIDWPEPPTIDVPKPTGSP